MFTKTILTILFLMINCNSLHLHSHKTIESYVNSLQLQQQNYLKSLKKMNEQILMVQNQIQSENNLDTKIQQLELAIIKQRKILSSMSLNLKPNLDQSEWTCQIMPEDSKIALQKATESIQSTLKDIENDTTTYDINENENQSLITDVNLAEKHNLQSQDTVKAKGQQTSQKPQTKLVTNLNAPNWMFGDATAENLDKQYQHKPGTTLRRCSLQQPYYDGQKCISCDEQEKKYFNMDKKECKECQKFLPKEHRCADDKKYDISNITAGKDRIIISKDKQIQDYMIKNKQNQQCPHNKPFLNGTNCMQCKKLYDIEKQQCSNCTKYQSYNSTTHHCEKRTAFITDLNSPIIIPNNETIEDELKQQEKLKQLLNLQKCISPQPYYNGSQCISCSKGLLFSLVEKKCMTCPKRTKYNEQTKHCQNIVYYSNLVNPKWVSQNKDATQIRKQIQQNATSSRMEECPSLTPFYNTTNCIQCQDSMVFSYDSLRCGKCPKGKLFSHNTHKCLVPTLSHQTNPSTAPNLIYDGYSINQWMIKYYNKKEKDQNMADCPSQKPYYDNITCINCPQTHPYYNMYYMNCQICQKNTTYSEKSHECLSKSGKSVDQNPTLQKMAAGIFA